MRKKYTFVILFVTLLQLPLYAFGNGIELGMGARAMAFGNNHTAVAKDLSAVYWNPAALALLPVREFHISFDGMRTFGTPDITGHANSGITLLPNTDSNNHRDRLRMSGIGAMAAIPTTQGGLTLALSFDRPYIFDDFTAYAYNYNKNNEAGTFELDSWTHGDLNRLSGAFGVQIAPKIAAGLTAAIIFGTERQSNIQKDLDYYDVEIQNKYLGSALSFGVIGYPFDILSVGAKFNIVSYLGFEEAWFVKGEPNDTHRTRYSMGNGRAYNAPSGNFGLGLSLPWLIAALDFRVTLPYTFIFPEHIPNDAQASHFKFGTGLGLEAPIPGAPVVLRAGYSIDSNDLYPMINKYDDEGQIDWMNQNNIMGRGFKADPNRHTIAGGIGVFTSGIGFELSYAYQLWGIKGNFSEYSFKQNYSSHRVMTSLIYRY
jgi:hypothetical protein